MNEVAFEVVSRATRHSINLDDVEVRKSIMREMGSRGGKKGGNARAQNLSPEKRSEIARKAAQTRWEKSRKS